jgi:DNA-binding response OmpR family regulator
LLHFLAVNVGEVCTSEQIVTHVWGYDGDGDASLIKAHIRHIRQKIEAEPGNPRYVITFPGVGYMLARTPAETSPLIDRRTAG